MSTTVPFELHWYLTKRCNLRCTHCYNYEADERPDARAGELDRDEAFAVAKKLADAGVFGLHFLGGEVLLVPWAFDLFAYCHELGFEILVATNGLLLTPERIAELERMDIQVQVSLDGARAETHDAVRGRGTFARTCNVLRQLAAAGVRTQAAFTIMRSNFDDVHPLIDLAQSLGLKNVKLTAFIPAGRSVAELEQVPDPADLKRLLEGVQERERASAGRLIVSYPCFMGHVGDAARKAWRPEDRARKLSCGAGMERGIVWEDGSVGACDFFRDDAVGDLTVDDIEQVWTGQGFERWRALDRVGGKCGSCGYRADCGFGCRAAAHYGGGDFFGGDPNCISEPPPGIEHPYHASEVRTDIGPRRLRVVA